MSRALRRQPLVQKPPAKSPSFRPSGPRPQRKQQAEAAAQAEAAKKRTLYDRLPKFFRDIISELRKVSWPTREETTRLTVAVIIVAVTIGLLLGGVDFLFSELVDNTILR